MKDGNLIAMFTLKGELVGVGRATCDAPSAHTRETGIVIKTDRVVMTPGTYPRKWKTAAE